jgi:hypothetical protein
MLKIVLVFALTSGLAVRAWRAWRAHRYPVQRQPPGSGRATDDARWIDDGGRVMTPPQRG